MKSIRGLSASEVERLTLEGKTNKVKNNTSRSVWDIVKSNVFTYFNLLHILLFVALLLVGAYRNMLFMCIIVVNTAIGTFQEIRAKRTIDRLSLLISPNATAIRDGAEVEVLTDELVQGDVVLFLQGSQICADCTVIHGCAEVNEALLTGESESVKKKEGDSLLSGSFISSGRVYARLDKVGDMSYAAQLTAGAKKHKKVNSEILNSLNKIIKIVGIVIAPIGLIHFCKQYFLFNDVIARAVSSTVALLVGMIPEGLYLLTSIALAVSVIRLGKKNTLVREMYAIEQLARVDTLCIDKTGTITSGQMRVCGSEAFTDDDIAEIMANISFVLSENTPTQNALNAFFGKKQTFKLVKGVAFSSKRKWQGCVFENGCYVCGAPEFVLGSSDGIEKYAKESKRVLALAKCDRITDDEQLVNPQKIAFIVLEDTLRPNVEKTFKYFAQNRVEIKVISGDNPVTVSAIARRAGIKNAEKYIDMSAVADEEIADICESFNVFGRVSPSQKRLLVNAFKKNGHTVAMTGDGVNDVLALKDADCSIAMADGSEAARRVATLVLTTSDFSSMPEIVGEGRRVINNVQRTASLFLVKTIFSSSLAVLLLFLPMSYPLQPIQVTLFGTLTIGIPAFFLALRSNKNLVEGNFLKNVFMQALPSGICIVVGIMAILVYNAICPLGSAVLGTVSTLYISFVGFLTLFRVCMPFDKRNALMFGVLLAAYILCVTLFKGVFFLVTIPVFPFLLMLGLMAVSVPLWFFILRLFRRKDK